MQKTSSSNSVTPSMEDKTKNSAKFLLIAPFDTRKWLSCAITQFPTLNKESFESLSLTPK